MLNLFIRFSLLLAFFLIININIFCQQKLKVEEWSGSITYVNKESSSNEKGHSNSEIKYEASITNGHGYAKAKWTIEEESRSQNNSYPYNWITTTRNGIAHGYDVTFLNIDIGDGTYTIEFTAPEVKGTLTTTNSPGSSKTDVWSENDNGSLITFDKQILGKNPNVLSGTFTEDNSVGGSKNITTISWDFVRGQKKKLY